MILSFFRRAKNQTQPVVSNSVSIEYHAVALTDRGSVRTQNQDRVLFVKPFDVNVKSVKGCLAIVADGMGGHKSGEIASQMATEIFSKEYFKSNESILNALKYAFETANQTVFQTAQKSDKYKGMGTTLSSVAIWNNELYVTHIGDSRIYLISKDSIVQLTKDHTYVQHLIDTKVITESERDAHPNGNVITKALGTQRNTTADIFKAKQVFSQDQKILICSDGLYEYIKDDELKSIILNHNSEMAAQKLISFAKKRGGHDNITVLIVERNEVENNSLNDTLEII